MADLNTEKHSHTVNAT